MSRRFLHSGVVLICALGSLRILPAQGLPPGLPRNNVAIQSSDQVVSPVAVATWVARGPGDGNRVLDLLVLWRGSPGWFARGTDGSGGGSSGGGDGRRYSSWISRGGVTLSLEFDTQTRIATIQGKPIELNDHNVILIDGVDDAKGPQVVGTLRVDPALPPGRTPLPLGDIMRRSQELVSFLRCDTRLDDPLAQKMAEIVCASVLGQ